MHRQFLGWSVPVLSVAALLGCAAADAPATAENVAPPIAEVFPPPARTSGPDDASSPETVRPSAQGDADASGLSPRQIEAMFASAFAQARPFEDHRAVCLVMMRTEGGGWPRNPPAHALAAFARWTDLPVFPGSDCAFDTFPFVIHNGAKAMLYTIRIEPIGRDGIVKFWANAVYGNLGANGAEFVLKRRGDAWHAEPTGVSAVS